MSQPLSEGTPSRENTSGCLNSSTDVSDDPTPSARAASWADQIAGKIEPPVGSFCTKPNSSSGTSAKWSARWSADFLMRKNCLLSSLSGSASAVAMRFA